MSSVPPALPKVVIGWREWISLPDLDIEAVKAKIDTGARSSSLHAVDIEEFRRRGQTFLRFRVHPFQRTSRDSVTAEAELLEYRKVRSSNGQEAIRPVIQTTVHLLGRPFEIELTLASRDSMGFRMLLGRQAMRKIFLVDPGRSYLGGRFSTKRKSSQPTSGRKKKKKKRSPE